MQRSRPNLPILAHVLPALAAALVVAGSLVTARPASAQAADCPTAGPAEVEAIARAYFDAFNAGDRAALDALLAPDYRQQQGAVVAPQDRALHLDRLDSVRKAFPDGVYTIDWLIVDGDEAAVRHTFRGTHRGEYADVPASGKPVAVGAFHVHRIACGKIAETWNAGDALGLFRQIGAIPGPATTPADEELPAPASPARASCPETTPAENEAAARRWYDEVLNEGWFEVLDELLAEDVVHHAGVMIDLNGREETAGGLRAIRAGFPDIRYTVDGVVAVGDTVLIRWTGHASRRVPGRAGERRGRGLEGMNAFRFACGRIVEGWSEANGLAIMRQIGALP
jgi:steroid delta-isomerase-like uncharacterized protein